MKRVKVWDLAVRTTHLLFGVLVLGAFLTSEEDANTILHSRLGLALLGVVLFRVVWGFVGTRHARFADFVRSPAGVGKAFAAMVRGKPGHFVGHNPVGAVMILALLASLLTVTGTGVVIALGPEWGGPLLLSRATAHAVKEAHEVAAWTLPVLVVLHVLGVLLSSVIEKQNLIKGMVTGWKDAPDATQPERPSPVGRVAGFVTACAIGIVVVFTLWRLIPIGQAQAGSPLLSRYEQAARSEDPSFAGFKASAGRALYFGEHDSASGKQSCATCHTSDPTRLGRSPVGKIIEPLAPSANPSRFTDAATADKWFDRNCKQVLGRTCTARERGDFVSWLLTL